MSVCDASGCNKEPTVILTNRYLLCAGCADDLFRATGRVVLATAQGGEEALVPHDEFWTPYHEDPRNWRALCSKDYKP